MAYAIPFYVALTPVSHYGRTESRAPPALIVSADWTRRAELGSGTTAAVTQPGYLRFDTKVDLVTAAKQPGALNEVLGGTKTADFAGAGNTRGFDELVGVGGMQSEEGYS